MAAVMIVARHEVISALIGEMVEFAGHNPVFPRKMESPVQAADRLHPSLVLFDLEEDYFLSDAMFAASAANGMRIIIFGSCVSSVELTHAARARGVRAMPLPMPLNEFRDLVASSLYGNGSADAYGAANPPA